MSPMQMKELRLSGLSDFTSTRNLRWQLQRCRIVRKVKYDGMIRLKSEKLHHCFIWGILTFELK